MLLRRLFASTFSTSSASSSLPPFRPVVGRLPKLSGSLPPQPTIFVSPSAVSKLKSIAPPSSSDVLRVRVDSGGCHGYQYAFDLTPTTRDDDIVFETDGTKIVIDALSFPFLENARIDYVDELIGASFKVAQNPNAESECGCKISFQAKE